MASNSARASELWGAVAKTSGLEAAKWRIHLVAFTFEAQPKSLVTVSVQPEAALESRANLPDAPLRRAITGAMRTKVKGDNVTYKANPNLMTLAIGNPYSRRQLIAGSAIWVSNMAITGARTGAQGASAESARTKAIIMVKAIHQEEDYKAPPKRIYEALLDARQFAAFSGGRAAEIRREVGGAFSIFAGHIVGRNLELVPNRRIVQAWRVVSWPEGVYSIARFELQVQGSGTRVIFDHTGFPPDLAEHLESGWQENYWKLLRKYLD